MFFGKVKDKDFRNKVVISFSLKAASHQLRTPKKDYKISSMVETVKNSQKKYKKFLSVAEVNY
jgi:hypothetical protein